MAESGPEDWQIDGVTRHVNRTYYVRRGMHEVAYIIEYELKAKSELFGINDERALKISFPLMVYAYRSGAYERTQFKSLRGQEPARTLIGVDLMADGRGYRIVQSIGDIVWRLKGGQQGP